MDSEQEVLPQPMTSSSQKVVNNDERATNISSSGTPGTPGTHFPSEPQLYPHQYLFPQTHHPAMPPLQQNPYDHGSNPSTTQSAPRNPEPSQLADHHHQHDRNVYDYRSTYADDMGDGIHPNDPHPSHNPTQAIHRYPSASEATTYHLDLNTPLNLSSLPTDHHPRPTPPLVDYRNAIRGYHHLQSHNLQRRQETSHLQSVPPLYHQDRPMGYGAERDSSDAPDLLQHSHPQMHQHRLVTPPLYDSVNSTTSSSSNNPSHTSDARSVGTAHRSAPYRTLHASSSIPMSNSPPPHHNIHAHPDFEPPQSLGHENLGHRHGRNVSLLAATAPTPQSTFHIPTATAAALVHPSISGRITAHHPTRSGSVPDPPTDRFHSSSRTHSLPALARDRRSPPSISDTESAFGSESIPNEENEDQASSLQLRLPGQADGQQAARSVKGKAKQGHGITSPSSRQREAGKAKLVPEKKKSKMHECQICQKKFPRPSGLKTHMNTHSNERPYPCGFPGCTRTFGVRSNAKRHLRTHGVIPAPSSGPADAPYVVGFSTPVILQPHPRDMPQSDGDIGGGGPSSSQPGAENVGFKAGLDGSQEQRRLPSSRVPAFKVRWMPPGKTARTNAPELQEGQELSESSAQSGPPRKGKQRWTGDEIDEDEDNEEDRYDDETAREMDDEDMDDTGLEDRMFRDAAAASRLSIPSHPVMSSSGSSLSGAGESSRSGSGLSLRLPSTAPHSQSPSLYSASVSPTLPQSGHLSQLNQPGGYTPGSASSLQSVNRGTTADTTDDFEERNLYPPTSSHPYYPSQRRNKK